jgi:WhiB family redox-sensing transcriptional regulator
MGYFYDEPADTWRSQANCKGMDVELFHATRQKGTATNYPPEVVAACAACPVREPCLEAALALEDGGLRAGYWGGTSPRQRTIIAVQRRAAGRPVGRQSQRQAVAVELMRARAAGTPVPTLANVYGVNIRTIHRRIATAS